MSTLSQFFGGSGGGGLTVPAFQGGPVANGITVAEVLLVGGGGNGAGSPLFDGGCTGGSSGEVIYSTALFFTQGTSYTITIGGAASNSSIVGTDLNLIAYAGNSGNGPQIYGHRNCKLDEYTTSYGFGGARPYVSPDLTTHGTPTCGGGALQPGREGNVFGSSRAGGEGVSINITGSYNTYGSGGGGGFGGAVVGGTNGGRSGGQNGSGLPAVANTGSGGGGGGYPHPSPTSGGAGGSGICVIRWPTAYPDAPSVSANTPTPAQPGYYVYRWNSGPGSITF